MPEITFTNSEGEPETIETGRTELEYENQTHHWVVTLEEDEDSIRVLKIPRENTLFVEGEIDKGTMGTW